MGQANLRQGNLVVDDFCGGAGRRTGMDSGIPAWILVPYIPLPQIRLPRNRRRNSLARLSMHSPLEVDTPPALAARRRFRQVRGLYGRGHSLLSALRPGMRA